MNSKSEPVCGANSFHALDAIQTNSWAESYEWPKRSLRQLVWFPRSVWAHKCCALNSGCVLSLACRPSVRCLCRKRHRGTSVGLGYQVKRHVSRREAGKIELNLIRDPAGRCQCEVKELQPQLAVAMLGAALSPVLATPSTP